jgi:hypothetical protein
MGVSLQLVLTSVVTLCNDPDSMDTFSSIIDAFGGPARFAGAINISANHAGVMKARDSIPPEYWPRVVKAADIYGKPEITFEALALIAAKRREAAA